MNLKNSKIVAAYRDKTPSSARLAEQARQIFPSGVTHDSRYLQPHGLYVSRAQGSRKWDMDGHEYVDYSGGHGALLLGHNHPAVAEAVARQLALGTHFGAGHALEVRWGELVKQLLPSAELVRFTSSGTESTLLALRLARAFTGKRKIVRFVGHFHGWHDHAAFAVSSNFDGAPTPGVLPELAKEIILADPGDIDRTRQTLESSDEIAAVIIEPTGASWGQVPVLREFLTSLRQLTADRGVLLIFDEVISGFRCSPGGAQASYGITPDLTTVAKILAGGFPGGAVAGRRDVMSRLAFAEADEKPRQKIPHQGTFNANPISAAAGITTLEIVATTDCCERANRYAERLRDALNEVLAKEAMNWCVYGTFSGYHIFTNPENLSVHPEDIAAGKYGHRTLKAVCRPELSVKLRLGMLLQGINLFLARRSHFSRAY